MTIAYVSRFLDHRRLNYGVGYKGLRPRQGKWGQASGAEAVDALELTLVP